MILAHSAARRGEAIERRRSASALTSDRRNGTGPIAMSPMTRSITPTASPRLVPRPEPSGPNRRPAREQASNERPAETWEHWPWTARPSSSRHGLPRPGLSSTGRRRPGSRGLTGIWAPDHTPAGHRITSAGQPWASVSISGDAWRGSMGPDDISATPDRPGLARTRTARPRLDRKGSVRWRAPGPAHVDDKGAPRHLGQAQSGQQRQHRVRRCDRDDAEPARRSPHPHHLIERIGRSNAYKVVGRQRKPAALHCTYQVERRELTIPEGVEDRHVEDEAGTAQSESRSRSAMSHPPFTCLTASLTAPTSRPGTGSASARVRDRKGDRRDRPQPPDLSSPVGTRSGSRSPAKSTLEP